MIKDLVGDKIRKQFLSGFKISSDSIDGGFNKYETINGQASSYFLKRCDSLIRELIEEIKYNRILDEKVEFEKYLESIKDLMNNILEETKLISEKDSGSELVREYINKVYYLQEQLISVPEYKVIQSKNYKSTTGNQKIPWKKQVNQLVDMFISMNEKKFIDTDTENLKLFLMNNFTFRDKPLEKNTINTLFDEGKKYDKLPKGKKKIDPQDLLNEQ